MVYPNRTHCICQGKNTTPHLFDMMTRFLDRTLMGATPAGGGTERAASRP
jgi:hypothetical protein